MQIQIYNDIMRDPGEGKYIKHIGSMKYNINIYRIKYVRYTIQDKEIIYFNLYIT